MLDSYTDRWALVTGASSGIGAEFASQLAARGMHLVLVARRGERMRALAEQLNTQHGTNCHIITVDLAEPDAAKRVLETVSGFGVEIELLVNNAGFGMVGNVESTDIPTVLRMLQLNISTLTELTYRILPGMLERGHGAIVNLSSLVAFQPVAYMAAYAASKSFVLHFSEALWAEVRSRGVTVLAVCPGATRTEFFEAAGVPGWLQKHASLSTHKVVKASLRALKKRRQYVVPGWKDYLLTILVRLTTRRTAVNESRRYFRPTKQNAAEESGTADSEPDAAEDTSREEAVRDPATRTD